MQAEFRSLRANPRISYDGVSRIAHMLIILTIVVALLFMGRAVLEPLAIAVLFSFILTPAIRFLRRWYFGRTASVLIVVAAVVAAIFSLGILIETHLTQLAEAIPHYKDNLANKVGSMNRALLPSSALKQASSTLSNLAGELKLPGPANSDGRVSSQQRQQPIPVEVQAPEPATLEYLRNFLSPLIDPLIMGGLLLLFLIFILFYREDLRDRILRLAGTSDLHRSTEAMNEAGERLSSYFIVQTAINVAFGCVIGIALWAIGIPNAILWALLSALLRFIPYVGTPLAAIFPLVLACAIEPGWTAVLLVAGLYLLCETVTGQVIEPVLQGQHTGLSPLAIVVCQLFWTLIWGAPGLLLAVPITVCLAVLGKHIHSLEFLTVILGDEPALAPHETLYQRLLAGDAIEAAYQAEHDLADNPLSAYYDDAVMKALGLAHSDTIGGRLSVETQMDFCGSVREMAGDLSDDLAKREDRDEDKPNDVVLVSARTPIDQAACYFLAHLLAEKGVRAVIIPFGGERKTDLRSLNNRAPCVVLLSAFGLKPLDPVSRFLVRRSRRLFPNCKLIFGAWLTQNPDEDEERIKDLGVQNVASTLTEASTLCCERCTELQPKAGHLNSAGQKGATAVT
jgi:predicted PurR-regulated permease PerM